jgi:hypothetical protein
MRSDIGPPPFRQAQGPERVERLVGWAVSPMVFRVVQFPAVLIMMKAADITLKAAESWGA